MLTLPLVFFSFVGTEKAVVLDKVVDGLVKAGQSGLHLSDGRHGGKMVGEGATGAFRARKLWLPVRYNFLSVIKMTKASDFLIFVKLVRLNLHSSHCE